MLCYYKDIETNAFRSAFAKEILSMMQFLITAKLFSDDWFMFLMFRIIFLRKAMLSLENILTYKKRKE